MKSSIDNGEQGQLKLRLTLWSFRLAAVVYALFQAYAYRFEIFSEDSTSYLDMARAALGGQFYELLNVVWSPLYPCCLAVGMALWKPDFYWSTICVRATNFCIFLVQISCFEFFLRQLLTNRRTIRADSESSKPLSDRLIVSVIYAIFFVGATCYNSIFQDTPDRLVSLCFYLALGLLLSIKLNKDRLIWRILLGFVCGAGLLSKSVFLGLGICFCTLSALCFPRTERRWASVLPFLTFTLVAAPYLFLLYQKFHVFGPSEVGRMSYMQMIAFKYYVHYNLGPEIIHPVRLLHETPKVYEFAQPIGGTYPPFYDRYYWFQGYKFEFEPFNSVALAAMNLWEYLLLFGNGLLLACGFLWWRSKKKTLTISSLRPNLIVLIPALVSLSAYSLSTTMSFPWQTRYIDYAVVAFLSGILCSIQLPQIRLMNERVTLAIAISIILAPFSLKLIDNFQNTLAMVSCTKTTDWKIAEDLKNGGITEGDKVAQLGYANGLDQVPCGFKTVNLNRDYHWAYLLNVRIVADIDRADQFFALPDSEQTKILSQLKSLGAKAIVMPWNIKPAKSMQNWQKLPKSGSYALFLR
jgi:hypothetical protein